MFLCLKIVVQLRTEEQKPEDPFSPSDQLSDRQAGVLLLDGPVCLFIKLSAVLLGDEGNEARRLEREEHYHTV